MDLYSIQDLFTGRAFRVPPYQRAYSWERQQWQDLVEDLRYLPEGRDHFTGMIVVEPTSGSWIDREGTRHQWVEVVDGQQRLTTLVVFLEALRRHVPDALAEGIQKRYIAARDAADQLHTKLQLAGSAQGYFEHNVLAETPAPSGPETAAERRLRDALRFFLDHVTPERSADTAGFEPWAIELHSKLTQRLKVMLYEVESDAEVGVMFEVMNNRGRQLSELDLVKNYVLFLGTKLDLPGGEARFLESDVADTWTRMLEALMDAGLDSTADEDRLLRASWLMAYNPNRRNWKRSRSIKDRFKLGDYQGRDSELLQDLREYVRLLGDCGSLFSDIYQPTRPQSFSGLTEDPGLRKQIVRASERLRRLNVLGVFLPLLMVTRLRRPTDGDLYLRTLELCERFAFRVYRVGRYRADAGESSLVGIAHRTYRRELDPAAALAEMAQVLATYSSNEKFEEGFVLHELENEWYSWGGLRYFLYEYEQHLCGADPPEIPWEQIEKLDREKTIEHVYPQTPDDPYWTRRFSEEDARKWMHDLGNLALSADNSSYQNYAFPRKRGSTAETRPCYVRSPMKNERELAEWTDWTPESISERRSRLVDFALRRWWVEIPAAPPIPGAPDDVEDAENTEAV